MATQGLRGRRYQMLVAAGQRRAVRIHYAEISDATKAEANELSRTPRGRRIPANAPITLLFAELEPFLRHRYPTCVDLSLEDLALACSQGTDHDAVVFSGDAADSLTAALAYSQISDAEVTRYLASIGLADVDELDDPVVNVEPVELPDEIFD